MPVFKRGRYWFISKKKGAAKFKSKAAAERAYRAYRARKYGKRKK
jgi:hypothetical protein